VIVDDGSVDGTGEMLAQEFPEVAVLRGDGNLFWTAATNMGIRYALEHGAERVMTLNNDTIASPKFVEAMLHWSEREPLALLGALNVDFNSQQPHYGGEILNWPLAASKRLLDFLPREEWKGIHKVSLYPGRGLLIPREVFEKIGLFDEVKLPHYMADYDFTLNASNHGFNVFCNYDAWLYIYPEEGGDHKIRRLKSLRGYYQHLFSIKGGGNLKNYTKLTLRNCPKKYLLPALLTGYARRIVGYWIR
jgi:GT2 family glycosyltransferase